MSKTIFKYSLASLFIFFFLNCEKDDICIQDIQETPDLILLMLDSEDNNTRKSPLGFRIRAIGTENILTQSNGDSIPLPLNTQEKVTQFEFILNEGNDNENIDTLQINYQRIDQFINRACGYRANFILQQPSITLLNPGNDWIKGYIILKDTITDEKAAHLGILY
ncbi:MAG: DUF6452 family protein [Flavobacteriaceae bacterium]|jgi:hypothetical protein|nr:DUF6452 family protein [Flavobacteriaceae bacterium]MDG2503282.1 DUF6452 family protein [Flavobacteriaceae bacterium]